MFQLFSCRSILIINRVKRGFNVILATSLVHFYPPKHHRRALEIIDDVLSLQPKNVSCLMGKAYIMQAGKQWTEAAKLFDSVISIAPDDVQDGLRAKEEFAWSQSREGNLESAILGLDQTLAALEEFGDRELDKARCLWRIGQCHWDFGSENN